MCREKKSDHYICVNKHTCLSVVHLHVCAGTHTNMYGYLCIRMHRDHRRMLGILLYHSQCVLKSKLKFSCLYQAFLFTELSLQTYFLPEWFTILCLISSWTFFKKFQGWKDGSVVKSTSYSSRDLDSIPSTNMVAICNSSSRGIQCHFWPLQALPINGKQTYVQAEHSYT